MKCTHDCEAIYTKYGIDMIIIDTKFQCCLCGKIFDWDDWQEILTDRCEQCNGYGKIDVGFNEYLTCTACKVTVTEKRCGEV